MKRKFLIVLLALTLATVSAFALAACGETEKPDDGNGDNGNSTVVTPGGDADNNGGTTDNNGGTTDPEEPSTAVLKFNLLDDDTYEVIGCEGNPTTIEIPSEYNGKKVTRIGGNALSGRSRLTNVTIPNSVMSIGSGAFWGSSLTSITVDENNKNYKSIDGNLYTKDGTMLVQYAIGKTDTSFEIPDSVTSIGEYAFIDCSSLTSVTMQNGIISIGRQAFIGCSSLTSITIPDSITNIGSDAFSECSSLQYNIEKNVKYLGNSDNEHLVLIAAIDNDITNCEINKKTKIIYSDAFRNCTGLTSITIPNGVTSIGENAFVGCRLTNVTIPNNVTSIGSGAFWGSSLTSITVDENNKNYKSIDGNLYTKDGTTLIQYAVGKTNTSFEILDSVTSIGSFAFEYCNSLTSITIPNSVTSIETGAFFACRNLTNITMPNNITSIGDYVFFRCSSLTGVMISNRVTSIGYSAFEGCSGLTNITIPNGVTSVGGGAFSECSSLTYITIPNSVMNIGYRVFYNCSSLRSITVDEKNSNYKSIDGNLYTKDGTTLIQYAMGKTDISFEVPNSVTSIGVYAFSFCSNLTSLIIPESVTSIGDYAFSGCSSLTSITIPSSVTSIGNYAFERCRSLTSVTIPNSVTWIGDDAFGGCSSLETINCEAESQPSGWSSYWKGNCSAEVVWGYKG